MKSEKETLFSKIDYRSIIHSPRIFLYIGGVLAIISAAIALMLPADRFVMASGVLGDKWGLLGIVVVLLVILLVNFIASALTAMRDKALFWIVSAASAAVSAGILMKVASVAYFW